MKKSMIALITLASATAFAATEIPSLGYSISPTVTAYKNAETTVGIGVSRELKGVDVTAAFDRSTRGATNVNVYTLTAAKDVVSVGSVDIAPVIGLRHIRGTSTGNALVVGARATYDLTRDWAVQATVANQFGTNSVRASNGSSFALSMKYKF